jgi:hypothetical protein
MEISGIGGNREELIAKALENSVNAPGTGTEAELDR